MAKAWPARYLDGKSSRSRDALARLDEGGITIRFKKGAPVHWPWEGVRQEQGSYPGEPVRLERGEDGEALVFEGAAVLEAIHATLPLARARAFHDPGGRPRRLRLTVYAGLAVAALFALIHFWLIPFLAEKAAQKIPVHWEKNLGVAALEVLAPKDDRVLAPKLQPVLDGMARRMAKAAGTDYEFEVILVKSPMVNAFALPGGSVVVMTGLLEKTKSPDELAGVLAHEMQHVIRRHGTRRVLEGSQLGLLMSVISGDASGALFGAQAAAVLAQLEYSRDNEAEADREGMRLLIKAGFDPQGMIRAFDMLKENSKAPEFLKYISTHPDIDGRITALKAISKEAQGKPKPVRLPPGRSWKSLVKSR